MRASSVSEALREGPPNPKRAPFRRAGEEGVALPGTLPKVYDHAGLRSAKQSSQFGETLYPDRLYQEQFDSGDATATKHIFVGQTRIASKVHIEGQNQSNRIEHMRQNTFTYCHLAPASERVAGETCKKFNIVYLPIQLRRSTPIFWISKTMFCTSSSMESRRNDKQNAKTE